MAIDWEELKERIAPNCPVAWHQHKKFVPRYCTEKFNSSVPKREKIPELPSSLAPRLKNL